MSREELLDLKKWIESLSEEEKKKGNIELRKYYTGELQGPMTGYASIDKPWLQYYTEEDLLLDVPKQSIYSYMKERTKDFDDKVALEYFDFKITYKEFKENVETVKKAISAAGIKRGEIVSVCLPNIPEVGYVFYALNDLGIVANMLDPRTNKSTLVQSVNDADSKLVISLDSIVENFVESKAEKIVSVSAIYSLPKFIQSIVKVVDKSMRVKLPHDERIEDYGSFIKRTKNDPLVPSAPFVENQPAVIAYTGGTTGEPKGVTINNEAFNAMIVENDAVGYNAAVGDKCLGMAPPWTFYGLSNGFNTYLCMGIRIQLIPQFGPDDLGSLTLKYQPNHIMTVPSALTGLMNEKKIKGKDLQYLKTVIVGADKLTEKTEEEFDDFMVDHNSQTRVTKGYGMTEVCAAAAYTIDEANIPGSVGIPFLFENISIFDPENPSVELPIGEKGEIAIRGPKNMLGYFGVNVSRTNDVLKEHDDGTVWAHTGDIGHMDEHGRLYVDGRIKRMFTKSGFKIFPGEIEKQMLKHPDVEQAAVVAVEDESNGFIAMAFAVLNEKCDRDPEVVKKEIREILASNLYDYEIPDSINIIGQMPLTQMNKVDYKALQEFKPDVKVLSLKKS